jgi:hypothetical protein
MYLCPSCREPTISFLRKWLSWREMPALCSSCHRGCAIAISDAGGIVVVAAVFITLSGFAAVAVQLAWVFVVGIAAATGFYFWRQHKAHLVAISDEETKAANRSAWAMLLLWLFPTFFN